MRNIKVDNCEYCNCVTSVVLNDSTTIEEGIKDGSIACYNCEEDGDNHSEFDVYDDHGMLLWCGHKKECKE